MPCENKEPGILCMCPTCNGEYLENRILGTDKSLNTQLEKILEANRAKQIEEKLKELGKKK